MGQVQLRLRSPTHHSEHDQAQVGGNHSDRRHAAANKDPTDPAGREARPEQAAERRCLRWCCQAANGSVCRNPRADREFGYAVEKDERIYGPCATRTYQC